MQMSMSRWFLNSFILALVLLGAAPAFAVTRYLDATTTSCSTPSDNDYDPATETCGGGGTSNVYSTVTAAMRALVASDVLEMRAGTYATSNYGNDALDTYTGGTSWDNATTVKPYSGETVTITGGFNLDTAISGAIQYFIFDGSGGTLSAVSFRFCGNTNHVRVKKINISNPDDHAVMSCDGSTISFIEIIQNDIHDSGDATAPQEHGTYFASGSDILIEGNLVYNNACYGIHHYSSISGANQRHTIRYNIVRDNARLCRGLVTSGGIIVAAGTGHVVAYNLVYRNGVGVHMDYGGTVTVAVHNNTIFDNDDEGIQIGAASSSSRIINNIIRNNGFVINDNGSSTTKSDNNCSTSVTGCSQTTDPGFVDSATDNFAIAANTSAVVDAGITSIGGSVGTITCNGSSGCTIGAHDPPRFSACSATGNTLTVNFTNNVFPPISFATVTGSTGIIDSTSRTLSAPTVAGSNQVDITFSGAAVVTTATYAYATTGSVRDSADIGVGKDAAGTGNNQRLNTISTQTCSVAAGSGTFEQKVFRFHGLRGTEALPSILPHTAAANSTNISVVRGGAYRVRIAVLRNTSDTVAIAPTLYYSKNAAAYAALPASFGADNIKFFGTGVDADIPSHLTATTNLLGAVGAGSFVAGAIIRTSASIPNTSLAPTNWTEFEWVIEHDTDSTIGDTFDFRARTEAGAVLDTYTVTPRSTIIDYTAGSGT